MLGHLLRNRLRMYFNLLRRGDRNRRIRALLMIGAWVVFMRYLFLGLSSFFGAFAKNPDVGEIIVLRLLALMLFGLLVAMLMSGITISIHTFFVSQDLPLLLSTPISRCTLFLYKLIEATLSNSSVFLMLGLPVLLSFGAAMHADVSYYIVAIILAAIFLLIPTSLSGVLSLLAVWILPVKRAREVMGAALALVFVGIWAGMQFLRSSFMANQEAVSAESISGVVALLRQSFFLQTPPGWMAKSLVAFVNAQWGTAVLNAALFTLFTLAILLIGLSLVENLYYRGLAGSESAPRTRMKQRATIRHPSDLPRETGSILVTLLRKDFRLLRRDLTQLVQFFMFAVMMIVMAIIFRRDTDGSSASQLESLAPFAFVCLFSTMSTVGLAMRLIPLEGKAFYITKITPQRSSRFVAPKLILGWLMGTAVSAVGVIAVTLVFKFPWFMIPGALPLASAVCLGTSGIGLVLGATFADFDWENPKRMVTTGGSLLSMIVPLLFLALLVGLGLLAGVLTNVAGYSDVVGLLAAALVTVCISVLVGLICLGIASRRIDRLAWKY